MDKYKCKKNAIPPPNKLLHHQSLGGHAGGGVYAHEVDAGWWSAQVLQGVVYSHTVAVRVRVPLCSSISIRR